MSKIFQQFRESGGKALPELLIVHLLTREIVIYLVMVKESTVAPEELRILAERVLPLMVNSPKL